MPVRDQPDDVPEEFLRALADLRSATLRPEVVLEEVPAPQRIAPHAVALTAEVVPVPGEEALASGRFVLLYDASEPGPWHGAFRAVTFVRAELEPELGSDPALGGVGWAWLLEALADHGAAYTAEGGTVTRVVSESFAALADRPATVEIEVRASWTPVGGRVDTHLEAWADLLVTVAGIPPLPEGVTALPRRT